MKPKLVIFSVLIFTLATAQNVKETDSLDARSRQILYQKPDEALRVNRFLFENSPNVHQKMKSLLLMSEIDLATGNYNDAIESTFQAWNSDLNQENTARLAYMLNELGRVLELDEKEILSVLNTNSGSEQTAYLDLKKGLINYQSNQYNKAISIFHQSEKNSRNKNILFEKRFLNYYLALSFCEKGRLDSAEFYTQKLKNFDPYFSFLRAKILFSQNKFGESINTLNALKPFEGNVQDIELRKQIFSLLAQNYLGSENLQMYKDFYLQSVSLNDSLNTLKEQARILLMRKINDKQQQIAKTTEKKHHSLIIGFIILIGFCVLGGYFYNRRLKIQYKKFNEILTEQEKREAEEKNSDGNKIVIPDKTIQTILEKLEEFENSQEYLDSKMSLQMLADSLNSNTKYLSEIINNHKNKNFHSYINELRVNYIISRLKNDPVYLKYKVSHLAEESGFTSHSTFSTVFKQITGMSPVSFINFLKKQNPD